MQSKNDRLGVWSKLNLVPYRGTTEKSSDRYLRLLYELFEHSPSFGAVVNDLITFAFDGEFDLINAGKAGIKFDDTELDGVDKVSYCENLEKIGLSPLDVIQLSKEFVKHKKISGNVFVKYRKIRVNDEIRATLQLLHPMSVKFKEQDNGAHKLVYSKNFFIDDWSLWGVKDNDFIEYEVYPRTRQTKTITETVFHLKTGDGLYGFPDTIQSLLWQYSEYALGLLASKVNGSEFVASHILEVPLAGLDFASSDDQIRTYLRDIKKALNEAATNKGIDPSSLAVMMNPSKEKFNLHKVDVNRDTDWFKAQEEIAKRKIYELNKSYPQLTGSVDVGSSLGQDTITALFLMYDTKTVKPVQREISNFWQTIMNFISDDCEIEEFKDVRFKFAENIDEYVEKLTIIKGNVSQPK